MGVPYEYAIRSKLYSLEHRARLHARAESTSITCRVTKPPLSANPPNDALSSREARLGALFKAALTGDAVAYKTFLTEASGHVRGYLKRRLQQTSDVEDLVQEVLLAIHNKRHTYDTTMPVTSWLFAIARYKLIDHLRAARASMVELPIEAAGEIVARDDHVGAESAYDLHKLLSRLPLKMRRAIECVKLEGLSAAEAAGRCGTSVSAVKVNVHRGLHALAASSVRRCPDRGAVIGG